MSHLIFNLTHSKALLFLSTAFNYMRYPLLPQVGHSAYFAFRTNRWVNNTMYILCIYWHIHTVKNTTIYQMVSLCNMQHYVIYNHMFRPCKWAIIRLFVEPVSWLYNRSLGGEHLVLHHILWGLYRLLIFTLMYSLSCTKLWYSS